jgi:hypothetical protein
MDSELSSSINTLMFEELERLNIKEMQIKKNEHFCTASLSDLSALESAKKEKPLKICEKYKPSYTSKKDQINVISDRIKMLRQSKLLMKQTINEIDELLDDKYKCEETNENDLEAFFKSKKCLASSLNISSLHSNLPRKDINPPKYIDQVNKTCTRTEKTDIDARNSLTPLLVPSSIFVPYDQFAFTDKVLLENRQRILESRKKNLMNKKRVLSAGFSLIDYGKAESDRGNGKVNNNMLQKKNYSKSRMNSAH